MYVMVKKPKGDVATWICPTSNYKIPARAPLVEIELLCDSPKCVNTRIDNVIEQISELNVSKPCNSNPVLSQQNGKSNIMAQKRSYPEENNILDEINTSMSTLLISNESHTNCSSISKTDNGTDEIIGLSGNTLVHAPTSSQGDDTAHESHTATSADENSNYEVSKKEQVLQNKTDKEGKPEEAASLDNELIWYITSEYLPYFKEPAVRRCPTNKRMKR